MISSHIRTDFVYEVGVHFFSNTKLWLMLMCDVCMCAHVSHVCVCVFVCVLCVS